MTYEFKLPDIGEGLTEGEVVKWHVKEGDVVKENQPLCNVLTDKAEVEIPSPKSGKIVKLMAKEGEKVQVHAALVSFEVEGGAAAPAPAKAAAPAAAKAPKAEEGAPETAQPETEKAEGAEPEAAAPEKTEDAKTAAPAKAAPAAAVSATPAVRKLAADLKVDLSKVTGTGPGGRITEADVQKGAPAPAAAAPAAAGDEKVPFIGIRRKTAEKMAQSARSAAAVTHMDEADFTALIKLRGELKEESAKRSIKLTYLPFIIKALVKALKEFPSFNAVLDEAGGAIVRRKACNIGIAVSAEHGLVVPVVKGAEGKDIWALAAEISALADKVRAGKVEVADLQGGTFTITNIGPIGGLFATPIINLPEVAILGVMKISQRPVVKDHEIHIRDMANLVLTFDHRVNDGAEAAHFMNTIIKHLENPRTLL